MLLALVSAACSDPVAAGLDDVSAGPDVKVSFGDLSHAETAGAKDGIVADGVPALPDVSAEVTGTACEFPADPAPGTPGAACDSPSDCENSLCVESAAGKLCTRSCNECCPLGFHCEQSPANDAIFLCLPKLTALCRPCQSDGECAGLSSDALCVGYAQGERYCGGACSKDADCTVDYACQTVTGTAGGTAKQCVRTVGACECSPKALAQGAASPCLTTNFAGSCSGLRKCSPAGLAACDAPVPATETCNGADDDCDGQIDETGAGGCTLLFADGDGDGSGKAGSEGQCLCAPAGLYTAANAGDCDDADKAVQASGTEACNGVDDDCDGVIDNGCDDDGDGWCDVGLALAGTPSVCGNGGKDCSDSDTGVHPGAAEVCGNSVDDDCDGTVDLGEDASGCTLFFADGDQDGFGAGAAKCLCGVQGKFTAKNGEDCQDDNALVHPGLTEVCGNAADDDCNGAQDEAGATGCFQAWQDVDGDGAGAGKPACLCALDATYSAKKAGDCDDANAKVLPGAPEACNGKDDDCDGQTDSKDAAGCSKFFADADKDGHGDAGKSACLCAKSEAFPAGSAGDCDDGNAKANPAVKETCNGADDDCNGKTDETGATGCSAAYADGDGDGFGDANKSTCLCAPTAPFPAAKAGDCNDGNPAVHPGAVESCNAIDDNCNSQIDEQNATGCSNFLRDEDGDGYGLTGIAKCLCKAAAPYSASLGGDCDDAKSAINPKAAEVCDGLDDNCDGLTDGSGSEGCTAYFIDKDADGYGSSLVAPKCLCAAGTPYVATQAGDCDDNSAAVYPKALESCNGKDDDCDGSVDPKGAKGCKTWFIDGDLDSYGVSSLSQCSCAAEGAYTASQGNDCNDQNSAIHPLAFEVQCDAIDQDCDGKDACAAVCDNMAEDFEKGSNGWALGPTWQVANWASAGGTNGGLGFGTGANYGGYNAASTASKAIAIPANAKTMKLSMKYSPDINELVAYFVYFGNNGGYDSLTVLFDGVQVYKTSVSKWQDDVWHAYQYPLPPGAAGTSKTLSFVFETQDGSFNQGFGFAVDNIAFTCN